jgi:DNA excision repair protein ERCC-1
MSQQSISNPYSRKSAPPAATTTNGSSIPSILSPPPAAASVQYSSFSQAFPIPVNRKGNSSSTARKDSRHTTASSVQPSTTAAAAAIGDTTTTTPLQDTVHSRLSNDRDFHLLLEQPHVLYVSTKQRGNGVLDYIRNVPIAYARMVPDYVLSTTRCALFLSLKYHSLYPDYIHRRVAELKTDFTFRLLLVLVDIADNATLVLFLNTFAVKHQLTLVLAWSEEEAARYLETYKALDGKDATSIQKRESQHFAEQVAHVLTAVKNVNQSDAGQLVTQLGTVRAVAGASREELGLIAGMGPIKVQRLYDAWHKPFSVKASRKRKQAAGMRKQQPTLVTAKTPESEDPIESIEDEKAKEDDEIVATTELLENESPNDIDHAITFPIEKDPVETTEDAEE